MLAGSRLLAVGAGLTLTAVFAGCGSPLGLLNPNFGSVLGLSGEQVATLPGDAPGLLVSVENRTGRWIDIVVSYRDRDDNATAYTTLVGPWDKGAQMLVCPVREITLGDVSDLEAAGVVVYLMDEMDEVEDPTQVPYVEVDPFGTLLREGVNYDCGDELLFVVQPSSDTRSGYRTFAFIRRVGAP